MEKTKYFKTNLEDKYVLINGETNISLLYSCYKAINSHEIVSICWSFKSLDTGIYCITLRLRIKPCVMILKSSSITNASVTLYYLKQFWFIHNTTISKGNGMFIILSFVLYTYGPKFQLTTNYWFLFWGIKYIFSRCIILQI